MLLLEVISGETLPKPDRGKMRFHKVSVVTFHTKAQHTFLTTFPHVDRQRQQSSWLHCIKRRQTRVNRCRRNCWWQLEDDTRYDLDNHLEIRHPRHFCGRNDSQRGTLVVVPTQNCSLQKCQCTKLPYQFQGKLDHWMVLWRNFNFSSFSSLGRFSFLRSHC